MLKKSGNSDFKEFVHLELRTHKIIAEKIGTLSLETDKYMCSPFTNEHHAVTKKAGKFIYLEI